MTRKPGAFKGKLALSWTEILTGLAVIVIGLLLLIKPGWASDKLFNVIGVIGILIGLAHIIKYCRLEVRLAVISNDMALGLAWIIGGIAIIIFKELLRSLPPLLFGLVLLLGGVIKVQGSLGLRRMNATRWYWELICAAISIVLGVIILTHALEVSDLLFRVIGASLVLEGVVDLGSRATYRRTYDRFIVETHFEDD